MHRILRTGGLYIVLSLSKWERIACFFCLRAPTPRLEKRDENENQAVAPISSEKGALIAFHNVTLLYKK